MCGFCTETKQNGRYNPTEYHWKRRARLNNCEEEAYYDSGKNRSEKSPKLIFIQGSRIYQLHFNGLGHGNQYVEPFRKFCTTRRQVGISLIVLCMRFCVFACVLHQAVLFCILGQISLGSQPSYWPPTIKGLMTKCILALAA